MGLVKIRHHHRRAGSAEYTVRGDGEYGYEVLDMIRKGLIPRRSFEDFPRAFLLSFQIITGDDWVNQMHDVMEVRGGLIPPLLFIANFAFCNFILLSLFIAVILENFQVAEAEKQELQKLKFENDAEAGKLAAEKPKISFIHRIVWFVGGEGGLKPGRFVINRSAVQLDTEGVFGPRDANGEPLEFGTLMPGNKWYNDNMSLFIFGPDNPARRAMRTLAENKIFDHVVLLAIISGTIILALEGPPDSLRLQGEEAVFGKNTQDYFDRANDVFFVIFLIEFVSKVI
eukprot:COSAG05_NODE_6109_length_1021_cov_0.824295_1_plen_284_part_10